MSVAIKEKMPPNGIAEPPRKKLKTSDLPLASATRASIEGLAHTFKKKGGYDSLRKQIWEDLEKSVSTLHLRDVHGSSYMTPGFRSRILEKAA